MSAQEIYDLLKDTGKKMTALQIANKLQIQICTIRRSLTIISTFDDISCSYEQTKSLSGKGKRKFAWHYIYKRTANAKGG